MKTLIFCEGTTDVLLIQFVLQYKYGWKYEGFLENTVTNRLIKRNLVKEGHHIEIISCGGINNIPDELQKLKDKVLYVTKTEDICDKVIVMIDHDTMDSNQTFVQQLNEKIETDFTEEQISKWIYWEIENMVLGEQKIEIRLPQSH